MNWKDRYGSEITVGCKAIHISSSTTFDILEMKGADAVTKVGFYDTKNSYRINTNYPLGWPTYDFKRKK